MMAMKSAPNISNDASKKSNANGFVYVSLTAGPLPNPAGMYGTSGSSFTSLSGGARTTSLSISFLPHLGHYMA